jgi:hypothetical protein
MIGGHRFLVSPLTSLEIVALRSRAAARASASASGARAARALRARRMAASAASAAASACASAAAPSRWRGRRAREIAEPRSVSCASFCSRLDVGDLLVEPRQPLAMLRTRGFELVALGGEVGERVVSSPNSLLGGERRFGFETRAHRRRCASRRALDLVLQRRLFGVEPLQRHFGVGGLLLLARDVGGELRQPAVEFGDALAGARFLAVERSRAMVSRCSRPRRGLGLAQRRQFGGAHWPGCGRPRPARGCARRRRGR